jgi:hypothetical protein
MHGTLTSQNTRNITVAYNLGFDLAVVDVLEKNSVNLKFPGKLTVSAGIGGESGWWWGKVAYQNLQDKRILTITLIM